MSVLDKIKSLLPGGRAGASIGSAQGGGVNKKAVVVGSLLAVSLLVMVVLFTIESGVTQRNKLYASIAAEQQVISQQIAVNALEAAAGREQAFDNLAQNQNRFISNLEKYNNGVLEQKLPPLPEHFAAEYSNLKAVWNDYDKQIAT